MTSDPRLRVTPRPVTGLAAAADASGGSGEGVADSPWQLWHLQVQNNGADSVVAQLLDARAVGKAVHASAQVIDGRGCPKVLLPTGIL